RGYAAHRRAGWARRASGAPGRKSPGHSRCCPSNERPAAKGKEGEEEARGGKGDGEAEDDLDQAPEAARGVTESETEPGDDDDDHRDDFCDRPLDAFENRLERRFPGHRRTA